jgi:hypothetical protein
MKTQAKYVEWLSAHEMHQATNNWISELEFIKDEQFFFDDLIKSYTLQLLDSIHYNASKKLVEQLSQFQKDTNKLLEIVKTHRNELYIVVDGKDQLKDEAGYRKEHKTLLIKLAEFMYEYTLLKSKLFKNIKDILKERKQKSLLKE